jgi:signal transduction histidine kinase
MNLKLPVRAMMHSLRWRLVALFVALAIAMTATFIWGTQRSFASGWRAAIAPIISDYIDRLATDIGTPPNVEKAKILAAKLPLSIRIAGPAVTFDSHPNKDRNPHERRHLGGDTGATDELNGPRFLQRRTSDGHIISFGLGDLEWRKHPTGSGLVTLVALLLLTAIAYLAVVKLLNPLNDIRAGAKRFGQGRFKESILIKRRDELGQLAEQINQMAADINTMLEAKRGLLLAISHELRSPLTRARVNVELLPEIGEALKNREALLSDLTVMNQLISDLLESERLNDRHAVLHREAVDLVRLVKDVIAEMPNAANVKVEVFESPEVASLDIARMRLLTRNLIDNAIQHGAPASMPPEVLISANAVQIKIVVRDFGKGVESNQLAKLGLPFYRADSARLRATGGVGLGLYLCKLVAQAHGGELSFENAQPGLKVTVVIPV